LDSYGYKEFSLVREKKLGETTWNLIEIFLWMIPLKLLLP
jgi:hypothetical protein